MKNAWSLIIVLSFLSIIVKAERIDRKSTVERNNVTITKTNPFSPSQVGNGKFAFGVDVTGLQTFVPFNTLSDWGWHSLPLHEGLKAEEYEPVLMDTHGRQVPYAVPNPKQPELSSWLAANPHRANLGRIGFILKKKNGEIATESDLTNVSQCIDLWRGVINSHFMLNGKDVFVQTVCHPEIDLIGVSIQSELMKEGLLSVFFDFPYQDYNQMANFIGNYDHPSKHSSKVTLFETEASIDRIMDDLAYQVDIQWNASAMFKRESNESHRFILSPVSKENFSFTCSFIRDKREKEKVSFLKVLKSSEKAWKQYWMSGAAVDLSASKDSRWKELERRIVLSQYIMRVNECGLYPPQEAGLVNNGWYGRFHFEMIWWHGVHFGLWNRWNLFDNYLSVYRKYLPTSIERAKKQGYKGARWPKCTADFDREWPHNVHATLIWQQPHPIYFAEMDYRLHPTKTTLLKWKDIVLNSADFMADYAFFDKEKKSYVLGSPLFIVSENTDMLTTQNPAFELSYWRYGLRVALEWCKRLNLPENTKWKEVLDGLSPLPVQDGLYVTHEGIKDMWTKFTFEHPALMGTWGVLPGDGVNKDTFMKTFDKVMKTWNFEGIWGWDFPMLAMAAARTGNRDLAIDLLLHKSSRFRFDEHGLCTGGPFPYFPSNGGLLTAVAMMCAGWDGCSEDTPGFPKDGQWVVKHEGFVKMQ